MLAYPTETVWGLGADARSDTAVDAPARVQGPQRRRADLDPRDRRRRARRARLPRRRRRAAARARVLARPAHARAAVRRPRSRPALAREDGAVGVRCSPHAVASELAARCATRGRRTAHRHELQRERRARRAHARGRAPRVRRRSARARALRRRGRRRAKPPSTVVDVTGPQPARAALGRARRARAAPVLEELAA